MNYPLLSEYIESIRSAEDCFDQLASLRPVLGSDGEPVMSSGNFAVVFKMTDGTKGYAVKCFTKEQEGRDEAYRKIAEELEFVQSSYLVPIRYLPDELFVDTQQSDVENFPVVLMDWVEGVNLDLYIRQHIGDEYAMSLLVYQFCRMAMWLLSQPFAHGDLKPDNILVRDDGTLVLVDYDGIFVPSMRGEQAREQGSPDYRHPLRTANDFNEHTDDFAVSVLALTLKALALQPSLLSSQSSDHLLFSESDYRDLSKSTTICSILALLSNSELEKLYALFLLAHSQKELPPMSYRLFVLERPVFPETTITAMDFANAIEDEYGVKYSHDMKRLLTASGLSAKQTEYEVKEGVLVICDNAFENCKYLEKLVFPKTVKAIGNNIFNEFCHLKDLFLQEDSIGQLKDKLPRYVCSKIYEYKYSYKYSERLKKLAEQGNADAQKELGNCYSYGRGVEKDFAQAVYWYRKAAEQGFAWAQSNLGACFSYGRGVEKDFAQAVFWTRKAAEQGKAGAQVNLGNHFYKGEGVEKDFAQAVYWYKKAAEQGNAWAQVYLGYHFYKGEGVEKDFAQAVYWYRKAAEQGNAEAQVCLGNCYYDGEGVEEDFAQAVYWYRKAAEQGNADAQVYLGNHFYKGEGVEKDFAQAVYWYRKAAEQGDNEAKEKLNNIEQKGSDGQQN